MMALIRYHVLPDTVLPAQVTFHVPPLTVAITVTWVPILMLVRMAPLVLALVRTFTPQTAAIVVVVPKTSVGAATDMTADERIARKRADTRREVSFGRAGRRRISSNMDLALGTSRLSPTVKQDHHPIGLALTGPIGPAGRCPSRAARPPVADADVLLVRPVGRRERGRLTGAVAWRQIVDRHLQSADFERTARERQQEVERHRRRSIAPVAHLERERERSGW